MRPSISVMSCESTRMVAMARPTRPTIRKARVANRCPMTKVSTEAKAQKSETPAPGRLANMTKLMKNKEPTPRAARCTVPQAPCSLVWTTRTYSRQPWPSRMNGDWARPSCLRPAPSATTPWTKKPMSPPAAAKESSDGMAPSRRQRTVIPTSIVAPADQSKASRQADGDQLAVAGERRRMTR